MSIRRRTRCLLLAVAVAAACSKSEPRDDEMVQRNGQPAVIHVDDEDPDMRRAIDDARRTVDVFIARLADPAPAQKSFSVKAAVTAGDKTEHMWLVPVVFRDGAFHGMLANVPEALVGPKRGDPFTVAKGEISDWMIVENGELRGGYSIRLLRARASLEDRAELDRQLGLVINDKVLPD